MRLQTPTRTYDKLARRADKRLRATMYAAGIIMDY